MAADELTGLIVAVALVCSSKSSIDVTVKLVRKGVPLDEHIAIVLEAMQVTADELALSVRPHPTISECRVEAARALLGRALFLPD